MNYLTFDIGGTNVKFAVISEDGIIKEKGKFKTPKDSIDTLIRMMKNQFEEYKKNYNFIGLALSAPGAVNNKTGVINGASAVPYIHGPNIHDLIKKNLGLELHIENDANCAALAEVWKGAAKECDDSLFIIIGTGIGGSVIKNKNLHTGKNLFGGEFGYMIMSSDMSNKKFDTLSEVASTASIVRNVAKRKGISADDIDGVEIFKKAEEGDIDCLNAIDIFYSNLAVGIFNLQHVYDPEIIVIGGAISQRDDIIENLDKKLDFIASNFNIKSIKPNITKCAFTEDANLIGAVYNYKINS